MVLKKRQQDENRNTNLETPSKKQKNETENNDGNNTKIVLNLFSNEALDKDCDSPDSHDSDEQSSAEDDSQSPGLPKNTENTN